jgi:endonuclease-3
MQSKTIDTIFEYFAEMFGEKPRCELNFSTDIECLVAIILSAQCTDKRVNLVTKTLFERFKTVFDYAKCDVLTLEKYIYSTGFYRNKARNIIAMARTVVTEHNGVIPHDFDALTRLAGVGRKTAGVFTVEYLKKPAMPVDTHITRVANRLGFTESKNPDIIERDLKELFDEKNWGNYHLYIVLFGRYFCMAKRPKCDECEIRHLCRLQNKNLRGTITK